MREDFKNRLFNAAIDKAKDLGFKITSVAQDDLKEFIDEGVEKMTFSEYQSTYDKDRAEINLMTLIDEMADNAKERRLYESLDYKSFSSAMASICPLWPFC